MVLYIGDKPVGLYKVVEKKVPKLKFGASVDTFFGDVVDGVLQKPTAPTALNFAGVAEIGASAMAYKFYKNTNIISVDLGSVQTVGTYGLENTFEDCSGITSVDLSSLQSVGQNGLFYAFYNCRGLTTIFFPSLTSVHTSGFDNAFQNCTNLTEIHFRADMQATIEAMSGYDSRWGATNATIYFDL